MSHLIMVSLNLNDQITLYLLRNRNHFLRIARTFSPFFRFSRINSPAACPNHFKKRRVMFTPSRRSAGTMKRASAAETTLSSSNPRMDKGKMVTFLDGPPPPLNSLSGRATETIMNDGGELDDWRGFKEAGLLDEAAMERKDRKALLDRVAKLESELSDYQYNMGLLLIDQKALTKSHGELSQALAEVQELLKREEVAHRIVLSDAEKREENLRDALRSEKKCVADLEKALREIQTQHSDMKVGSQTKLADAKAMLVGIEEKSLEVNKKLHAAEASVAEANRKGSELDHKLQEVESRESVLRREQLSFNAEREAHEATFRKQKEDLLEWERRLQEREVRLCDGRKDLKEREDKVMENERVLNQKQIEVEETQKKVDSLSLMLKSREDNINAKLADLISKEKVSDTLNKNLEMKKKELLALEEKLMARERMEIQTLLDEHSALLDGKSREFELEMEQKRRSVEKELRIKVDAVSRREIETNHGEDKLLKQEQALEKKSERLKEKEKDLDARLKILKEKEKSIKGEEKKLELDKKEILSIKENVESLKDEINNTRAEIAQQELRIQEENRSLKISEEERSEYNRLQIELKQEIEKCRHQKELLLKEGEDLKKQREKFEEEWEILDEKRAEINKALQTVTEEKGKFEKLRLFEDERAKAERTAMQEHIQRELENIRLEKESFDSTMKHELLALEEKSQNEHSQLLRDFERRHQDLEISIHNRQEEMEKSFQERESAFEEQRERELKEINKMKGVVQKEMEEMRFERRKVEKEKEKVSLDKKLMEGQQIEMRNDINELGILSMKIKDQREEFIKEKHHFRAFVEKLKSCNACGEIVGDYVLSNLVSPEIDDGKDLPVPRLAAETMIHPPNHVAPSDGEHLIGPPSGRNPRISPGASMSWMRKCASKLFNAASPSYKIDHDKVPENVPPAMGISLGETARPSIAHQAQSDSLLQEDSLAQTRSFDDCSYMGNKAPDLPEDSEQSELKSERRKPGRKRKTGIRKTHSVKEVVEEAAIFLGEKVDEHELNVYSQQNDSANVNTESQENIHVDKGVSSVSRKRQRLPESRITESEQDGGDSEGRSDSVSIHGRRKKRQTVVPSLQTPGEKRYNLRRHKILAAESVPQAVDKNNEEKNEPNNDGITGVPEAANPEATSARLTVATKSNAKSEQLVQVTTAKTIEIDDFSSGKAIRLNESADVAEPAKSVENAELSEEVNGTPSNYDDEEQSASMMEVEGEDEYEDEDDKPHPGEASIGKKLWTFFTT